MLVYPGSAIRAPIFSLIDIIFSWSWFSFAQIQRVNAGNATFLFCNDGGHAYEILKSQYVMKSESDEPGLRVREIARDRSLEVDAICGQSNRIWWQFLLFICVVQSCWKIIGQFMGKRHTSWVGTHLLEVVECRSGLQWSPLLRQTLAFDSMITKFFVIFFCLN